MKKPTMMEIKSISVIVTLNILGSLINQQERHTTPLLLKMYALHQMSTLTHLQSHVCVYVEWESLQLGSNPGVFAGGHEPYHSHAIVLHVLVQQFPVPGVQLQVPLKVLKHHCSIFAPGEIGQSRQ